MNDAMKLQIANNCASHCCCLRSCSSNHGPATYRNCKRSKQMVVSNKNREGIGGFK